MESKGDEGDRWDPACWGWVVPDLSHLHGVDPIDPDGEATQALTVWQAGRCAMCGNVDPLKTDHDKKTALVRGLLCRSCNRLEASQQEADTAFGRYRQQPPTTMLGLTIRYWDPIRGFAEPEEERDEAEDFRRAAEAVNAIQLGDSSEVERPDREDSRGEEEPEVEP